jgi:hypothetical protein
MSVTVRFLPSNRYTEFPLASVSTCRAVLKTAVREEHGDMPLGTFRIRPVAPQQRELHGKLAYIYISYYTPARLLTLTCARPYQRPPRHCLLV